MYIVYIIDEMFQPGHDRIAPLEGIGPVIAVKHALLFVLAFKK